uniref:Dynamin N-terminal domain-containing protein n=1 Tax=Amphilophus citrinellus TaxID=61819 RepID=A0A3Q0R860_AMPCI
HTVQLRCALLKEYKARKCKDLALPAISVIGDQSSGKSSVLEALSGVALPRGSGKYSNFQLKNFLPETFMGFRSGTITVLILGN